MQNEDNLPKLIVLEGPSKLPELGKGLGKTMKGFQVAAKVIVRYSYLRCQNVHAELFTV